MTKPKKTTQPEDKITDPATPEEPVILEETPQSDPIDTFAAELAGANEKYLRLAAEYDNFRKRSKKERESLFADAFAMAVGAFLPLLDALDNAIRSTSGADAGVVQLVKLSDDILKRLNVTAIDPQNEPFDAELHNAVMHVEDDTFGQNEVIEVLQKGYKIEDKVIRHAMVKVAN